MHLSIFIAKTSYKFYTITTLLLMKYLTRNVFILFTYLFLFASTD